MGKRTFSILLMAAFSAMLGLGIISPFLPELVRRHSANGFWMGMIFAGFAFSRGVIMPFVGKFSDRVGRKVFVSSGLLLFAVISLFYPKVHSMYDLTLVRMAHGLAAGLVIPIVMAYGGEFADKGQEGSVGGYLTTMFYLGLATGPFIGGIINRELGFNWVFYIMSILGFIAFLIVVFFLPESKPSVASIKKSAIPFRSLIKYNFVKAMLIIAMVNTLMLTVFMSFVPSLAHSLRIDAEHIGIIISVSILVASLLQIPSGKFSDRLDITGKLFQISAGVSISMISLFVMPFCPDFVALLVVGAFLGLGAAMTTPVIINISMGIGQNVGMGTWMGIINTAMSAGFMTAPLIAGIVMDHMGIEKVFYVLALVAFSGSLCYFHYVHKRLASHKMR